MRVRKPERLFRLLPAAFDRLRDLLVLLGHLCEAVLSQTLRPRPVPFRRLLARFLRLVLGRHRLPSREGGAGTRRAGRKSARDWLTEPWPRARAMLRACPHLFEMR